MGEGLQGAWEVDVGGTKSSRGGGRAPRPPGVARESLRPGRTSLEGETGGGPGAGVRDGEVRVQAGKNRAAQVVPAGGRELFGERKRRQFLEWFAWSGNVAWSARRTGISDKTVWRHRMNCPDFAEAFDRAQEQGVARAKAAALAGKTGRIDLDGDWEPPALEDYDPQVIRMVLDGDARRRAGGGRQAGRAPAVASNAEVEAALAKRLALLSARVRAKAAAAGAACPGCGRAFEARDAEGGEGAEG